VVKFLDLGNVDAYFLLLQVMVLVVVDKKLSVCS
jgi:hypothetical protein